MKKSGRNHHGRALTSLLYLSVLALLGLALSGLPAAAQSCTPVPTGLIGWWQGDGTAGDALGLNNGTLVNGAGFGSGEVGQGFALNGVNQYLQVPTSAAWSFGANDFSLEMWVNFTTRAGIQALVADDTGPGTVNKWIFWLNSGSLQLETYSPATGETFPVTAPWSPSLNQWHHVALTRSGLIFSLYADGVLLNSAANVAPIPAVTVPLTFGAAEGSFFLSGMEDEISIYSRALAPGEIQAIVAAGALGKCRFAGQPVILQAPRNLTVDAGSNALFTVVASATNALSYQWQFNGADLSGATDSSYTVLGAQPTDAGSYTVIVTNLQGSVTAGPAILTVNAFPPTITTQPQNVVTNAGRTVVFRVIATGNAPLGYQWQFSGTNLAGATSSSLLLNNVQPAQAGIYDVVVSNVWGTATSLNASLTVNAFPPTITNQPVSQTVNAGATVVFTVGAGGNTPLAFQWQLGGTNLAGATSSRLTIANVQLTNAGNYAVLITNLYGTALSSNATLAVNVFPPGIAVPPVAQTVNAGASVLFSVAATGTGPLAYQWSLGGVNLAGATTSQLSLANVQPTNAGVYQVVITSPYGTTNSSATLTVNTFPPALGVQPRSQTILAGRNVSFTVSATGTSPLAYQWYYNGTNLLATTGTTLNLTNVPLTAAGAYSVVVTNAYGAAASSNAQLTVNAPVCAPVLDGLVNWWPGDGNANDVYGANQGALMNGAGFVPGEVGQAFKFNGIDQYVQVPYSSNWAFGTNDFTVELWVNFANAAGTQVLVADDFGQYSLNKWIFWLRNGSLQLESYQVGVGEAFPVTAPWTPTTSQWHHVALTRNGALFSLYMDGVLGGTGTSSFSLPAVNAPLTIGSAEGLYFVNGAEDEIGIYKRGLSAAEILSIYNAGSLGKCAPILAPTITSQPESQSAVLGFTANFSAAAGGPAPLAYQWLFNGAAVPGATNPALNFISVQLADAGGYSLQVTNAYGAVTSSVATLTVNPPTCAPVTNGLINWWAAERNPADSAGGNDGSLMNGAGYASGEVGQGFAFNGVNQFVQAPYNPAWAFGTNNFTVELWVKLTSAAGTQVFVADDAGQGLLNKWIFWLRNGILQFETVIPGSSEVLLGTGVWSPTLNQWHHIAVTRNGNLFTIYADGNVSSTVTSSVVIPAPNAPLTIGAAEGLYFVGGVEDELAIYSRSLAAAEIQAIYYAGSLGKCLPPAPPSFTAQPQSQTVDVGDSVSIGAGLSGAGPLGYQWFLNNVALSSATSFRLDFANVQLSAAGAYSLVVTNPYGSVTSSVATLTVNQLTCAPVTNGLVGWWAAEGDATDSVGGNPGALQNGAGFTPGKVGQAFGFNGLNQFVSVPYSPAWAFDAGNFSCELWVKLASTGGTQVLLAADGGSGYFNKWIFWLQNGALQLETFSNPVGEVFPVSTPWAPTLNQWHHVALTRNGSLFSIYLDGALSATGSSGVVLPNGNAPLTFGAAEGAFFLNGAEDEIALFNRALSATEVRSIYLAGGQGKCVPIVPPSFTAQPVSQSVFVGADATFSAAASGPGPLAFQWLFNGVPLPGATTPVLTLSSVSTGAAGSYALSVSNLYGAATSAVATLMVTVPTCSPAPLGLLSWWAAEGNAADSVGNSSGILQGAAGFAPGRVGQAFSFDGVGAYVQVPGGSEFNPAGSFSLEAWIYPLPQATPGRIIMGKWSDQGDYAGQRSYCLYLDGNNRLGFGIADAANQDNGPFQVFVAANNPVPNTNWTHATVVYDSNVGKRSIYLNGQLAATRTDAPITVLSTTNPFTIGARLAASRGPADFFAGRIDEASFYGRALTPAEVLSLFNAGSLGKCPPQYPPLIAGQPISQTVASWTNASFTVSATGTTPLAYQWSLNGTPLPGATSAVLTLTNVSDSTAGIYTVTVTNLYGSVTSSNATLTVLPPPSLLQAASVTATSAVVVVPINLRALGTEKALGFSVVFDPIYLTFAAITLGDPTAGASVIFNTNSIATGKIGVLLSLPGSATFPAGTQTIAAVSFFVNSGTNPVNTSVSFGDAPTSRQVSGALANSLPASFASGVVTIPFLGFEGDVAPLPNGDGAVTAIDWVQVGRFVAGLDTITNASEFQRVDCAPRATYGDGQLTVADWVQAGRYAAGLDPLTVAGGPSVDVNGSLFFKQPVGLDFGPQDSGRILKVVNAAALPSQACQVSVQLTALGNENAVGFSVKSDPSQVQLTGVTLGGGDSGATILVNTNQTATNGVVGVVLSLPIPTVFSPGTYEVARLNFKVLPTASNSTNLAFTNKPTISSISDANGIALSTTYQNGVIIVGALAAPTLRAATSPAGLVLTWPLNALGYTVQTSTDLGSRTWTTVAATPIANGSDQSVTLAVTPGAQRYYRLYHP